MADSKISDLPAASPAEPVAADLLALAQENSPGIYTTVKLPFSAVEQVINTLITNNTTNVLDDLYVNVTGDTMTGNLVFDKAEATNTWSIVPSDDSSLNIVGETYNQILTLNPGTASAGNTGQTITGRFRYAMPIVTQNTSATLGSGGTGVATSLVRCSNGSPMNITIRANTASLSDFDAGNFFSVLQEGAGQVTILPETGNVVLRVPTGYIAATRAQYSVISATLFSISGATQTWVISGDLAEAP